MEYIVVFLVAGVGTIVGAAISGTAKNPSKRLREIECRLETLEAGAEVVTFKWGKVTLKKLARIAEGFQEKEKPPAATDGSTDHFDFK